MGEDSFGSMNTMKAGGVPQGTAGRIDQYELVRKLGGGGFGVVWLVRDTVSGVEYALKTLHPLLKTNEEELERVRDNFALVAKLSHPNIATAHVLHRAVDVAYASEETRRELRVAPGDPVMLMSYAPGVTLSKWRKQFPGGIVPLDKALEIARQVASALDYAHGERIVHRDIKPGNVMVETDAETGRLRARVLDFGLAAEIRSSMSRVSQEGGDTSGTRPYMAPEQWEGRKQDGRSDQYALACVAYELLSGEPPFAGAFDTGDSVIMERAIFHGEPESIDGIPDGANAALLKALAKKREDRFGSCGEFIAALGGENVRAAKPETSARPEGKGGDDLDRRIIMAQFALSKKLSKIPGALVGDSELKALYDEAKDKSQMAENALKAGMKDAAIGFLDEGDECLGKADRIIHVRAEAERRAKVEAERKAREEAERKAREEAERKAREEAVRKAREEAVRKAREEAERKAREEAERKAREEAERKARAEAERRAKVEAERKAREEAERKVREEAERIKKCEGSFAGEEREIEIADGVKMAFVWVTPGSFKMGSDDIGADFDETPVHDVTLTKGYWLGKYEVTQAEWRSVMESNPSSFKGIFGGTKYSHPVENVSWNDCKAFVRKINDRLKAKGEALRVRLPTEAEWEFAAKGGTKGQGFKYCGSDNIGEIAWYFGNCWFCTHEVGAKAANELGLHDMSGNVFEWCEDRYGNYPSGPVTDPVGPGSGICRVNRGGGWDYTARCCRPAYRGRDWPIYRSNNLGVRLAAGQ